MTARGKAARPRNKKGPGRNPFAPTAEQRQLVAHLAGFGVPQEDIRMLILKKDGKPLSLPTLEKYFRQELDTGELKANAQVAGALYKKAIGGDTTAMIFWLKTRARWRETNRLELTGANGGPMQAQAVPMDLSRLSPEQLQALEDLVTKALPAPS